MAPSEPIDSIKYYAPRGYGRSTEPLQGAIMKLSLKMYIQTPRQSLLSVVKS